MTLSATIDIHTYTHTHPNPPCHVTFDPISPQLSPLPSLPPGALLLAKACSRLRSLDLSFCPEVTEAGVDTLARGVTGLTTLKLNGNGDRVDARFLGRYLVLIFA